MATSLDVQQPDSTQGTEDQAGARSLDRVPSVLSWEAPEYQIQPKTTLWYAMFGVVLALLLFIAFLMRSFLTGVVFTLLGVLVLLYSERPARLVRFQLTGDAFVINKRRYPFRELDAFNIIEAAAGPLMLLRGRRLVLPLLHVPIADQDPEMIRAIVSGQLKEDPDLHESLADLLTHRLGF